VPTEVAFTDYDMELDSDSDTVESAPDDNMSLTLAAGATGDSCALLPISRDFSTRIVGIACGWQHSAAVDHHGWTWAWGWGQYGALGHGSTDNEPVPRKIRAWIRPVRGSAVKCSPSVPPDMSLQDAKHSSGGRDADTKISRPRIRSVACGTWHSVYLAEDGHVFTCGWNKHGQLGQGSHVSLGLRPTAISMLPAGPSLIRQSAAAPAPAHIVSVACGNRHTVALDRNGQVYAWGWNERKQVCGGACIVRSGLDSMDTDATLGSKVRGHTGTSTMLQQPEQSATTCDECRDCIFEPTAVSRQLQTATAVFAGAWATAVVTQAAST